ncbi:opioid growth factor receptor-like protein 1 isoform X2 [Sceloporus undulatus]|uniref:opioid growth factor receptor-like protein 1 isoform X2 n=1 Tax=Sceloporus undulatus TaxID=8520 RepID=UPI001C4D34DA|nr:opioid growth factor receptor-like protein 1 isoform X2 [Sceloporus undulatus]
MGSFLGGVSFQEPATVEDCDSTWETDSEPEEEEEEEESPGAGGGSRQGGPEEEEQEEEGEEQEEEEEEEEEEQPPKTGEPLPAPSREGEENAQEEAEAEQEEGDREEAAAGGGGGGEGEEGQAPSPKGQGDDATEMTAKPKRSFYAARDLYKYRHQYPNFKDLRYQNDLCNLRFYKNKIPFKPDGVYIEEVLNKWKGDYEKLEHNHTYIQWLFPLREQGLNFYAKELTTYEIEEFKKTKEAIRRFLLAYKMMLEFFGIKLTDKNGNVSRASNWQERFQHLNESQHNYLRITRILKSLGELGYESFKPHLVKFILHEALVEDTIPNIKQSALEYFVYTIRDRRERRKLLRFAQQHYTPAEHFIWGPPRKEKLEGSKSSKKLSSPVSHRTSCASKHKKARDCKNASTVCSSSGKASDEKRAERTKNDEDSDQSSKCTSSPERAKQSNSEKNNDVECSNSKLEETGNPLKQKENASHVKKLKGKSDDNLIQDCRNPENDSCDSKNDSTNISTYLQDNVSKDQNPVELNMKNKEESQT